MGRPRRGVAILAAALASLTAGGSQEADGQESGASGAPPPTPAGVALLSAALPGAGQYRLGQRRAWAYLALEAVAWGAWLERRGRGGDLRDRYRDFAWERGRIQLGPRADGDFRYYETLTQWVRSGAFDGDPAAAGLQPEADEATFNGSVWGRARRLFGADGTGNPTDPAHARALEYYRDEAYGEAFLWDWSARPGDRQRFADLISESDDRFREATAALGAVLANHALAAVDAFVSARRAGPTPSLRFGPGPPWGGSPWLLRLTVEGLP